MATGSIAALVFCLGFAAFGCDFIDKLTATKIKDILAHPRDYEDKEVTIYGTVTDVKSIIIAKYFEVQDDTGRMKVVTDRSLPAKGEKIKVIGRTDVIEVGSERWVSAPGEEQTRCQKPGKTGLNSKRNGGNITGAIERAAALGLFAGAGDRATYQDG